MFHAVAHKLRSTSRTEKWTRVEQDFVSVCYIIKRNRSAMQAETDDMNAEEYSRYKMQLHAQRSSLPSMLPREAENAAASMSLAFSGKWDKIDEVLFQNKVVEFIKDVPKGESVKQKTTNKVARRDRHAKIQGKREFPDKDSGRIHPGVRASKDIRTGVRAKI